ncbi:MAG: outer membrane beta-barrel protein [Deltaproteobacteria bacterium]|nr:outer membrane beta-barrel protein [Deltaproteobacteria bacterium]
MKKKLSALLGVMSVMTIFLRPANAEVYYNKTIGGNIFGSIQLAETLPIVDPGIGGGMFFDYRFNDRFSIMIEGFFTTQDGDRQSSGEGSIEFLAVPVTTFKVYVLSNSKMDPYFGIGIGLYGLLEGDLPNNTGGFGLGAQIETGLEFNVAENLMVGVGGTFRSVGLLNSLSGTSNATAYMPYTLFGRIGYRF